MLGLSLGSGLSLASSAQGEKRKKEKKKGKGLEPLYSTVYKAFAMQIVNWVQFSGILYTSQSLPMGISKAVSSKL